MPRPPGARPGGRAPWASLPAEERRGITVEVVRAALDRVGHLEPIPAPFGRISAAVLIPIFDEDGEARVILTRRASHLRSHRHEVAFPGGRIDADETPLQAALREAEEEIALDVSQVEVLGQLAPLATLSSSSSITPFVGVLSSRPEVKPNPSEVERVFDIALADLLADGIYREERWDIPGVADDRPVLFFELEEDLVWGATARILGELLGLVLSERTGRPGPER